MDEYIKEIKSIANNSDDTIFITVQDNIPNGAFDSLRDNLDELKNQCGIDNPIVIIRELIKVTADAE